MGTTTKEQKGINHLAGGRSKARKGNRTRGEKKMAEMRKKSRENKIPLCIRRRVSPPSISC
jgi:hypothetical protein